MSKPVLLDLYCGAGGATRGYQEAGFEVWGVDLKHQPHYCGDRFFEDDALNFWRGPNADEIVGYKAVHASPPCQAYTNAQRLQGRDHPELVEPTRGMLEAIGLPYVIENVPRSPLIDPVVLCGSMFGLRLYRHRLFECSFTVSAPPHPKHLLRQAKMGRPPKADEVMQPVGHFSGVAQAREAMGIDWMVRDELSEAIPPAYTKHIGQQLMAHLEAASA